MSFVSCDSFSFNFAWYCYSHTCSFVIFVHGVSFFHPFTLNHFLTLNNLQAISLAKKKKKKKFPWYQERITIWDLKPWQAMCKFNTRKGKSEVASAAKSLQSCLTPCDPTDGSPPGSPVPGILQARTLEWVAISFSNVWKWSCSVMSDS